MAPPRNKAGQDLLRLIQQGGSTNLKRVLQMASVLTTKVWCVLGGVHVVLRLDFERCLSWVGQGVPAVAELS